MSGDHNANQNDFKPDWDMVKAYEDKFTEMLDEIQRLRAELKRSEVYKTPEDEPVGQMQEDTFGRGQVMWFNKPADQSMLYTRPQPAAQWVGLTDEEVDDIWNRYCDEMGEASINDAEDIARAIEKALKEKNTS